MSASAAPVQYVYAQPGAYPATQGAAVPMEPVAGQPQFVTGAPQVTYQAAPQVTYQQAGGHVTYGAPQIISQGQSVSVAQHAQDGQSVPYVTNPVSWNADTVPQHLVHQEAAPTVTYLTQPAQEGQYITAAPQYVTPAQPAQVVQQHGGAISYAAPTMQGATYAVQGATTQYASQGAVQYALPSAPSMVAYPGAPAAYFPMNVQMAWDNHFSAFGAKDVEKILLDYDETSLIRVFTSTTGQLTEFRGTVQIREFFSGVFRDLVDLAGLEAPVQIVEEEYKQVFLVWKCSTSGIPLATDTFIFGPDNKIKRQNIVLQKQAGFVAQGISSVSSGRRQDTAGPTGSMASAAAAGASQGVSSAKASKKKDKKDKDSKKKLSSKKKAKSGFC